MFPSRADCHQRLKAAVALSLKVVLYSNIELYRGLTRADTPVIGLGPIP